MRTKFGTYLEMACFIMCGANAAFAILAFSGFRDTAGQKAPLVVSVLFAVFCAVMLGCGLVVQSMEAKQVRAND